MGVLQRFAWRKRETLGVGERDDRVVERSHPLRASTGDTANPTTAACPSESAPKKNEEVDPDTPGGKDVALPKQFDYYTDGSDA